MSIIINAKGLKEEKVEEMINRVKFINNTFLGCTPTLVIINASDREDCARYIKNKIAIANLVGVKAEVIKLENDVTQIQLFNLIERLNNDLSVHGIILQLPIFDHLDAEALISKISPAKDVDAFSDKRISDTVKGIGNVRSATPRGVEMLLDYHRVNIEGSNALVVGRGLHTGKSMANILLNRNATVTIAHSKTDNLEQYVKNSDIIITSIGKQNSINPSWIKENATIIGIGISFDENGKQQTDYDPIAIQELGKAKFIGDRVGCSGLATCVAIIEATIEACVEQLYNSASEKV